MLIGGPLLRLILIYSKAGGLEQKRLHTKMVYCLETILMGGRRGFCRCYESYRGSTHCCGSEEFLFFFV